MPPRRTRTKPAVVEEPEVDELEVNEEDEAEDLEVVDESEEDEVDEFDELDVDEDEEVDEPGEEQPKPRSKAKAKAPRKATTAKSASNAPAFGTKQLVDHVNKMANTEHDGRSLRIVLRALSNEGVIERNVGSDRERYSFTGPNDPQVKAIVAEVKRRKNAPKAAPVKKAAAAKKPVAKATTAKKTTTARTTGTAARRTRAAK